MYESPLGTKLRQLKMMKFASDNNYSFYNKFHHGDFYLVDTLIDNIKANITGCRLYRFGYEDGIDGITIVVKNKLITEFGELLYRLEQIDRNKANEILNYILEKIKDESVWHLVYYNNFYIHFGVKAKGYNAEINRLYISYDADYSEAEQFAIAVLGTVLETYERIKNSIFIIKNILNNRKGGQNVPNAGLCVG